MAKKETAGNKNDSVNRPGCSINIVYPVLHRGGCKCGETKSPGMYVHIAEPNIGHFLKKPEVHVKCSMFSKKSELSAQNKAELGHHFIPKDKARSQCKSDNLTVPKDTKKNQAQDHGFEDKEKIKQKHKDRKAQEKKLTNQNDSVLQDLVNIWPNPEFMEPSPEMKPRSGSHSPTEPPPKASTPLLSPFKSAAKKPPSKTHIPTGLQTQLPPDSIPLPPPLKTSTSQALPPLGTRPPPPRSSSRQSPSRTNNALTQKTTLPQHKSPTPSARKRKNPLKSILRRSATSLNKKPPKGRPRQLSSSRFVASSSYSSSDEGGPFLTEELTTCLPPMQQGSSQQSLDAVRNMSVSKKLRGSGVLKTGTPGYRLPSRLNPPTNTTNAINVHQPEVSQLKQVRPTAEQTTGDGELNIVCLPPSSSSAHALQDRKQYFTDQLSQGNTNTPQMCLCCCHNMCNCATTLDQTPTQYSTLGTQFHRNTTDERSSFYPEMFTPPNTIEPRECVNEINNNQCIGNETKTIASSQKKLYVFYQTSSHKLTKGNIKYTCNEDSTVKTNSKEGELQSTNDQRHRNCGQRHTLKSNLTVTRNVPYLNCEEVVEISDMSISEIKNKIVPIPIPWSHKNNAFHIKQNPKEINYPGLGNILFTDNIDKGFSLKKHEVEIPNHLIKQNSPLANLHITEKDDKHIVHTSVTPISVFVTNDVLDPNPIAVEKKCETILADTLQGGDKMDTVTSFDTSIRRNNKQTILREDALNNIFQVNNSSLTCNEDNMNYRLASQVDRLRTVTRRRRTLKDSCFMKRWEYSKALNRRKYKKSLPPDENSDYGQKISTISENHSGNNKWVHNDNKNVKISSRDNINNPQSGDNKTEDHKYCHNYAMSAGKCKSIQNTSIHSIFDDHQRFPNLACTDLLFSRADGHNVWSRVEAGINNPSHLNKWKKPYQKLNTKNYHLSAVQTERNRIHTLNKNMSRRRDNTCFAVDETKILGGNINYNIKRQNLKTPRDTHLQLQSAHVIYINPRFVSNINSITNVPWHTSELSCMITHEHHQEDGNTLLVEGHTLKIKEYQDNKNKPPKSSHDHSNKRRKRPIHYSKYNRNPKSEAVYLNSKRYRQTRTNLKQVNKRSQISLKRELHLSNASPSITLKATRQHFINYFQVDNSKPPGLKSSILDLPTASSNLCQSTSSDCTVCSNARDACDQQEIVGQVEVATCNIQSDKSPVSTTKSPNSTQLDASCNLRSHCIYGGISCKQNKKRNQFHYCPQKRNCHVSKHSKARCQDKAEPKCAKLGWLEGKFFTKLYCPEKHKPSIHVLYKTKPFGLKAPHNKRSLFSSQMTKTVGDTFDDFASNSPQHPTLLKTGSKLGNFENCWKMQDSFKTGIIKENADSINVAIPLEKTDQTKNYVIKTVYQHSDKSGKIKGNASTRGSVYRKKNQRLKLTPAQKIIHQISQMEKEYCEGDDKTHKKYSQDINTVQMNTSGQIQIKTEQKYLKAKGQLTCFSSRLRNEKLLLENSKTNSTAQTRTSNHKVDIFGAHTTVDKCKRIFRDLFSSFKTVHKKSQN